MKGVREPRYFRRLFLALAALCAATALMAVVGIFGGEESRELSAGALESFRAGLSDVFSPVRLAFAPGEDPYGGALEASAADRVTLGSAGLDQIPAEERTVTALYYGGPGNGRRAVYEEEISPSGARLTRRTGPFGWEITELPPDENRRVWLDNLSIQSGNILYVYAMAVYYDGGNPEVESLLERLFGEPAGRPTRRRRTGRSPAGGTGLSSGATRRILSAAQSCCWRRQFSSSSPSGRIKWTRRRHPTGSSGGWRRRGCRWLPAGR